MSTHSHDFSGFPSCFPPLTVCFKHWFLGFCSDTPGSLPPLSSCCSLPGTRSLPPDFFHALFIVLEFCYCGKEPEIHQHKGRKVCSGLCFLRAGSMVTWLYCVKPCGNTEHHDRECMQSRVARFVAEGKQRETACFLDKALLTG